MNVTTPSGAPAGVVILRNWFAIWSLILGIVSLFIFCISPLFGIPAIVLGILGIMNAPKRQGVGKPMSIAGIILGVVGSIGFLVFLMLSVFAVDSAKDSVKNWTGTADSSQYSYTIDKCEVDTFGDPSMTLTVRNKTSSSKSWMFDYEFRTSSGTLIDSGTSLPSSVPANGSTKVEISGWTTSSPSSVKCSITGVSNWFN